MSEFTHASFEKHESAREIYSALTVEFVIYAGLALAAFFIRVFLLDAAPLNSNEARQAIASWNFVRGSANTVTGSPLLFTLDAILFALFGASDFTARLAPAFFGTSLVMLPVLFQRELGRMGALISTALLAFSPSLVFFSRTLDGVIPAVTCALAALAFSMRYFETHDSRNLYGAVAAAAFALLTAPDVWTIILAFALYGLASLFGWVRQLDVQAQIGNQKTLPLLLFALIFLGVSTTFLLHREGMGAAFDLFAAWLDSLRLGSSPIDMLRLLVVYEPLVALFGLAALIDIVFAREKNRLVIPSLLGFWFLIAFILISLCIDNNSTRMVVFVVPLALLSGSKIGTWIERVMNEARAVNSKDLLMHEAPILAIVVGLMSFLAIVLAELAQRGNILTADALFRLVGSSRENSEVGIAIVSILFSLAMVATSVLAVTMVGVARAKNVGVLIALSILSVWTIRQLTMLNFPNAGALNPQEWIVARAASSNVRDLKSDLEDQSRWRANDTHTLGISVDSSLGPIIEWYLRDFTNTRFSLRPTPALNVQALLLIPNAPGPADGWIAQRYQIEKARGATGSVLRSLIFRDIGNVDTADAVLWIPKP